VLEGLGQIRLESKLELGIDRPAVLERVEADLHDFDFVGRERGHGYCQEQGGEEREDLEQLSAGRVGK
jgi:hypothetical protein